MRNDRRGTGTDGPPPSRPPRRRPAPRWDVRHVAETGSTNADLAAIARDGAAEGTVVVADHQTAGRGRRDRRWDAPPGSALLASVLLRPDVDPDRLGLVPLAAGAAIADAARAAGAATVATKWPNDVVVAGDPPSKLAGVLGELLDDGAVVVGFGVNLSSVPQGVSDAVSMRDLTGTGPDRDAFLADVLARLGGLYARILDGDDALVDDVASRMDTIGRRVRVEQSDGHVVGSAVALDRRGHLVVRTGSGDVTVTAGDVVHLRRG